MRPAGAGTAHRPGLAQLRLIGLGVAMLAALAPGDSLAAESQVILRPAAGAPGTVVQVTGRGFPKGRRVIVDAGRRRVVARSRGERGRFSARIRIRAGRGRWQSVVSVARVARRARRARGRRVARRRRVVSTFRLERRPHRANVGEVASSTGRRVRWRPVIAPQRARIRIRGAGFGRRKGVKVSLGRTAKRARSTRRGRFAAVLTAPARPGRHVGRVRSHGRSLRLVVGVGARGAPGLPSPFPSPGPPLRAEPVIAGAGDIASSTRGAVSTAALLDDIGPDVVYTTGDNAYPDGSAADYANFYEPTWGRFKARTRPVPGNHDYHQAGAGPYFDYFGALAGEREKGYYAYSLGAWRLYALNSNISMKAGSPQESWLRLDLSAHPHPCVLAYWHHPRFTAGEYEDDTKSEPIWRTLYEASAEVVLTGHDHNYQRYAPLGPAGAPDPNKGIREFVVGTGGNGRYSVKARSDGFREVANDQTMGVLKLTLRRGGYNWQFVPAAGMTFTDSGSGVCH
jgi:hypothetical protein